MAIEPSFVRRIWDRLDAFDLSLISLVAGYMAMIFVGFLIGNIYLILDGVTILLGLFVFLGGVVAVHTLRSTVKHEGLELSDRQFVIVSLSIVGSLAASLWIGPWTLVMSLLFVPAITSAIFGMAFKNKRERSEYRRLARDLAESWS